MVAQCWYKSHDGKTAQIFIAPSEVNAAKVAGHLLHEMIHACCPEGTGHKGQFVKLAKLVGFLPPWTRTPESDGLKERLEEIAKELGEYPHVGLDPLLKKKQTTRMLLYECGCAKVRKAGQPLNALCLDCSTMFKRVEKRGKR